MERFTAKRFSYLAVFLSLLIGVGIVVLWNQQVRNAVPTDFWTSNYEQITGLSAVQTLTVPGGATGAIIQAEDQGLRLRYDGTDPDASTGLQIIAGDYLVIEPGMIPLGNIELIEETATAKANVLYLR